jgi:hypothetical protein
MKLLETQGGNVSTTELRRALANAYLPLAKFSVGEFEDACEALQALLYALHSAEIGDPTQGLDKSSSNTPCRDCPAHQFFNLQVCEQIFCNSCGATSEVKPWDFCTFSQTFYVNEFVEVHNNIDAGLLKFLDNQEIINHKDKSNILKLVNTLQHHFLIQLIKPDPETRCPETPSACEDEVRKKLNMMSCPRIFVMNLVWSDSSPSLLNTLKVLASIPYEMDLSKIYDDQRNISYKKYLKGMILYGMSHYISYFLNDRGEWMKYDDVIIRKVNDGDQYDMVLDILKGRFHPVMVFYTEKNSMIKNILAQDLHWLVLERYVMIEDEVYEQEIRMYKEYEEKVKRESEIGIGNEGRKLNEEVEYKPVYSQPSYLSRTSNIPENKQSVSKTTSESEIFNRIDELSSYTGISSSSQSKDMSPPLPSSYNITSQYPSSHNRGPYTTFTSLTYPSYASRAIPINSSAHILTNRSETNAIIICSICEMMIPSNQNKFCSICSLNFIDSKACCIHGTNTVICNHCKENTWTCNSCGKLNIMSVKTCGLCKRNRVSHFKY